MGGRDVKIRWHLELVGDSTRQILKQDRDIRTSLTATDRLQRRLATAATQSSRTQARAAQHVGGAVRTEGRQHRQTAADVRALNRAQAEALHAGARVRSSADSVTASYRQQERAARRLTAAERARSAGSRLATGAQTGGAGLTRGTQAAIGAAAGGGIVAKAVSIFAGFEQQMDRVAAVTGATAGQMRSLNEQAKQLGAETAFSAREAADGMYQLATAGFKTSEVMRILPGTLDLASASGVDLAAAAELQAAAIRGFGLRASDAGHVADVLAKSVNVSAIEMADLGETLPYVASTARQTGTSFEQVAAAAAILGNAGIKGSMAGTALRTSMLRLTDPSKKMVGVLSDLGIESNELAAMPLPDVIARVAKGLERLPSRGAKVGAISALFGKEAAPALLNLMAEGADGINKVVTELEHADGTAKRTAKTMRDNVAGAWDQFTGSLETAAITLTTRFGPALKGALSSAAGGINRAADGLGSVLAGVASGVTGRPIRTARKAPAGMGERASDAFAKREAERTKPTTLEKIGQVAGGVMRTIAVNAVVAGKMLLDALKPAQPFLENILLPLLEGIGKGVLSSVVGAFKVLVPVIKIAATVLGFLGTVLKPLSGVFRGIGTVIGFIVAGGILKLISLAGKLGGVFRVIAGAAKILLLPLRLVSGAVGLVAKRFSGLPGALASVIGRAVGAGTRLARGVITAIAVMPGRLAGIASSAAARVVGALSRLPGRAASFGRRTADAVVEFFGKLPGRIDSLAGTIAKAFLSLGRKLVTAVVDGIKASPGAIVDAITSIIPKGLRDAAGAVVGFVTGKRRGGLVYRQDGGLIPSMVSPGELITYGTSAWTVPGTPVAADSVYARLPAGAAVWTGDGQSRLARGEDPASVLQTQLPHFRVGGRVGASMFGGPKDSSTRKPERGYKGDLLERFPMTYAELGMGKALGGLPYKHPLRITYGSRSVTARKRDIGRGGGDVGGLRRAIDLYYHVASHLGFNGLGVVRIGATSGPDSAKTTKAKSAKSAKEAAIRPSRRRAGLLDDALAQGIQAGQEGLTRSVIKREGNPVLQAIREALAGAGTQPDKGSRTAAASRSAGQGGGLARFPAGSGIAKMQARAAQIDARHYPYAWGGGHGRIGQPSRGTRTSRGGPIGLGFDCSGAVSAVLNAGGLLPAPPRVSGALMSWGKAGSGRRLAVHADARHVIMRIGSRYWGTGEANPNGGAGWLPGNTMRGRGVVRTWPGFRAGGLIAGPKTLAGAASVPSSSSRRLSRGVDRALDFASGSLEALDAIIGGAAEAALLSLRTKLLAQVRKGGPAKTIKRLQSILDVIDFELGRRIGRILDVVQKRVDRLEQVRGQTDRDTRRAGIDPQSSAGIQRELERLQGGPPRLSTAAIVAGRLGGGVSIAAKAQGLSDAQGEIAQRRANVVSLQSAVNRARKRGDRKVLAELLPQLTAAQDDLDEVLVQQVERTRDLIRAKAQENVDRSAFGLELTQGALTGLDIAQRGNRTADTSGGMLERAAGIRTFLIPAIMGQIEALRGQEAAARQTGDEPGARAAMLAIQAAGNDLATAVVDAAELVRNAAIKAAQDVVDAAQHRTTLATTGLQRLELEQKLAGTFEAGGVQRAQFIQTTIVPALQGELEALKAQVAAAQANGTPADVAAAIEAASAKEIDLLQAQLEAQEATAENTAPRKFGGTLGFSYGGETLTDSLIAAGNGA